ncbi:MAG: acyltransferase [Lachnospiraceae bacterium]|nr:acyltransferase [Lachnospiraceae bacterium]
MNKTLNYIKNGIPLGYMIRLKLSSAASYFRGGLTRPFFGSCGKRFKRDRKTVLIQKCRMKFGAHVQIGKNCEIDALSREGIIIDDESSIADYSVVRCTGSLAHIGKGVAIGKNSHFGDYLFMGAAGGIIIGDNVIGGQNIRFHSENHIFSNPNELIVNQGVTHKGIRIGNNCWIGAGAVFLDGAVIGEGCVVAANAVVTKQFGSNLVIGGVPAKVIENRCAQSFHNGLVRSENE